MFRRNEGKIGKKLADNRDFIEVSQLAEIILGCGMTLKPEIVSQFCSFFG
jgi:hypothetical protein